jgi:hypothetical protein
MVGIDRFPVPNGCMEVDRTGALVDETVRNGKAVDVPFLPYLHPGEQEKKPAPKDPDPRAIGKRAQN